MLDPRGGAGKPPLPRAVRSVLSQSGTFPKGPNESASGEEDEGSADSVNDHKKGRKGEKPSVLAHVNGGPSHVMPQTAPVHVTLFASGDVSKALNKNADGKGMAASLGSNEKGLDGWKKRTDQLAAAVLASARLSRGPSSPPSPPVVADPPPPYPPETSPAPFSRPPSLPDSPVGGHQIDLTSEWTLSQTEWTGLGLGTNLPTNPNSPNPMSPTDSNYHLLDPNSIPPMPPPFHQLPPDASSVPPFQPVPLKPSSVPPIPQPNHTLTMRPVHIPQPSIHSPSPHSPWIPAASPRMDERASIPPQTPPPLPYPLANMAPVFIPDPDAPPHHRSHYGSAAPIMQHHSVPPLLNRGSAPPTPQAVLTTPNPQIHTSQRSPPSSLYSSSPGIYSSVDPKLYYSHDPKLYYSQDSKSPRQKDPKSPRRVPSEPQLHPRRANSSAGAQQAKAQQQQQQQQQLRGGSSDPSAKSPRPLMVMVGGGGLGSLNAASKSPRQRDPKSPRQHAVMTVVGGRPMGVGAQQPGGMGAGGMGDGGGGSDRSSSLGMEPDLVSASSTKSESVSGKAAVAGVGIVFKDSKREGIRVVSVVKGGGASRSTRPPFPGDVLIGVDGNDDAAGVKYETHLRRTMPNLRPLGDDGTTSQQVTPRTEKSDKSDKRSRQDGAPHGSGEMSPSGQEEGDSPMGVTASFININEELERVRAEAQERLNSALRRERMLQEELRAVRETSKARSRMEQEHRSQLEAENEKLREDLKEESKRFRAERARRETLEGMINELQRRGNGGAAAGAPRKMEMPSAPRMNERLHSDEEDDTNDVTSADQAAGGTGAELVASTVVQGPGTDDDQSGDSSTGAQRAQGFPYTKITGGGQPGGLAGAYF